MRNAQYITLLISLLLLASCGGDTPLGVPDDCKVYLVASVEDGSGTRVAYTPNDDADDDPDTPNPDHPLSAEVWASSTAWSYPNLGKSGDSVPYEVAYHTDAHFQSGGPQLLSKIIYAKLDTPPLYFVAMTPHTNWNTTDGTQATYLFHGHEDVMFAPQATGKYGNKDSFGNPLWPTLHFHHLLTWLRLEVKAESEEVAEVWGNLTDITIESKNSVSIDLTRTYDPSCVTFSGSVAMPFYRTDDTTNATYPAAGGEPIPHLAAQEVAYVLCAPVDAKAKDTESEDRIPEYTITIKTTNRAEGITIPIDLKSAADVWYDQNTMGKQFTLSLTFKMGNNITTGVLIEDWKPDGFGIGNLDENE